MLKAVRSGSMVYKQLKRCVIWMGGITMMMMMMMMLVMMSFFFRYLCTFFESNLPEEEYVRGR